MKSVLQEINTLRSKQIQYFELAHSNRYSVIVNESDGTKTAYYFSAPILTKHAKKIVDIGFKKDGDTIKLSGTSADASISKNVILKDESGCCVIEGLSDAVYLNEGCVVFKEAVAFPTTNGIVIKSHCDTLKIVIKTQKPFTENILNGKCFCLMSERFRPWLSVSAIGVCDNNGYVVAPVNISAKSISLNEFEVTVKGTVHNDENIMFELNLYENKLFQDTTVESANPTKNNAFGGTAFIGKTFEFGEQWLYSRIMYNLIYDNVNRKIIKAKLHFPKLGNTDVELNLHTVQYRFCSFGSTWNNRKSAQNDICQLVDSNDYLTADITDLLIEHAIGQTIWSRGMILKPQKPSNDFAVISTGDSCYKPIIFELNYR